MCARAAASVARMLVALVRRGMVVLLLELEGEGVGAFIARGVCSVELVSPSPGRVILSFWRLLLIWCFLSSARVVSGK